MALFKSKMKSNTKRRKGALAFVVPWLKRFGIGLAILAFGAWSGAWFFLSDADTKTAQWIEAKMLDSAGGLGFTVEDILIEGRVNTNPDVLKGLINMQRGDPLFAFHPDEAKDLIERITWVRAAHVERRLPDTIYIRLDERVPMARWQDGKATRLLDERGAVIGADDLERFKDLMLLEGEDAPAYAPELMVYLRAEPLVFEHVRGATWIGDRRWDLTLASGTVVKLPEKDIGLALARLDDAHTQSGLLEQKLKSIDLREPERIIIRTQPGAVHDYKTGFNT